MGYVFLKQCAIPIDVNVSRAYKSPCNTCKILPPICSAELNSEN